MYYAEDEIACKIDSYYSSENLVPKLGRLPPLADDGESIRSAPRRRHFAALWVRL